MAKLESQALEYFLSLEDLLDRALTILEIMSANKDRDRMIKLIESQFPFINRLMSKKIITTKFICSPNALT